MENLISYRYVWIIKTLRIVTSRMSATSIQRKISKILKTSAMEKADILRLYEYVCNLPVAVTLVPGFGF